MLTGGAAAVGQTHTLDELALGQAALYLTGVNLAEYDPPVGAPGKLIVDAQGDTAGTPPASIPAGLVRHPGRRDIRHPGG